MKNKLYMYIIILFTSLYGCKKNNITINTNNLKLGEAVLMYNSNIINTNDSSEFIYNFSFLEIKNQKIVSKSLSDTISIEYLNSYNAISYQTCSTLVPSYPSIPPITSHIMLFNPKDSRRIYFENTGVFLQNYINSIKQDLNFKFNIGYWNGNSIDFKQNDTSYMHTFYNKTYIKPYKFKHTYDVSKNDNEGINYIQKDELLKIIDQAINEFDNSLSRKAITLVNYSIIDPSIDFSQPLYDSLITRLKTNKIALNIITYQNSSDLHKLIFSTGGFICASYQDFQDKEDPFDEMAYFNKTVQPSNVAIQNLHQILSSKPSDRISYSYNICYNHDPQIYGHNLLTNILLNIRYKNVSYKTYPKLN